VFDLACGNLVSSLAELHNLWYMLATLRVLYIAVVVGLLHLSTKNCN